LFEDLVLRMRSLVWVIGECQGGDDLDGGAVIQVGMEAPVEELLLGGGLKGDEALREEVVDGLNLSAAIDDYAHGEGAGSGACG